MEESIILQSELPKNNNPPISPKASTPPASPKVTIPSSHKVTTLASPKANMCVTSPKANTPPNLPNKVMLSERSQQGLHWKKKMMKNKNGIA